MWQYQNTDELYRDELYHHKYVKKEMINGKWRYYYRYGKGNIDLLNRPMVRNKDGSISTVRSMSFYDDRERKEILVPTVVNGRIVSDEEAKRHYYKTGQHLGKFKTANEATKYAEYLHKQQETIVNKKLNKRR